MTLEQLKQLIADEEVKAIDLKYCGLDGRWHHITFPARSIDAAVKEGIPFDGSSIPGMKAVEAGDMVNMPDLSTAYLCPFAETPTIRIMCTICDADTRIGVKKDPRSVALRADAYMKETGIADESLFIPELEYYLFDEAWFYNEKFGSSYGVTSAQDRNCLPEDYNDVDGTALSESKGYHMDTPFDKYADVRQEMVNLMEDLGVKIRYHHHEVGLAGQQEIETELSEFPKIADQVMMMKDVIRFTALHNGLTATLMPKPIYNEAGNGMHFHIMLKKDGKNVFYKKDSSYADLSDEAIWFMGGILKHGRSLTAFTNPSTNSFKRLLPGFEAPTKLFFGLANRSAAIRIPKYATEEDTKRIEFRTGDATCNPYLAMSALIMAGLDGIKNKVNPADYNFGPHDDNVFAWPEEKKATLQSIPKNLDEALDALQDDYEYLLAGDVFNKELIDSWIALKRKESAAVNNRPHPYEMNLYYNL